jgi:flagellin
MGSFSIINNISALNAQNKLVGTETKLRQTLTRLSTGMRINSSGDDAAGLAIADGLRADVMALNQAARNANDGVSLLQTQDSALAEITNLLTRAVTLAEQAASGTSGADNSTSKVALNDEFQDILEEIRRMSQSIEFNGLNLLGGATTGTSTTNSSLNIQVGLDSRLVSRIPLNTVSINVDSAQGAVVGGYGAYVPGNSAPGSEARIQLNLGFGGTSLITSAKALTVLATLQESITNTARTRGDIGSGINRLRSTVNIISNLSSNLQSAESQIRDANIAAEIVNLTQYQILTQTGMSALAQANSSAQNVLRLLQ